jgi:hypothetical protein
VPLKHVVQDIVLPAVVVTAEEAEEARCTREEILRKNPVPGSSEDGHARYEWILLQRYASQGEKPVFRMELHVMRLGDIALCTNSFELFLDYGLQIKARSKALQTFVVQQVCDWGGYLPTDKAVAGGHYSVQVGTNMVRSEGGQILVEKTIEAINSLF